MAQKFWYYIDLGSGLTEISTQEIQVNLTLSLERGVVSDFIQRKKLEGNFLLSGTSFTNAETYFITNGNEEAEIAIYENGDSIGGTLIYEGWARVNGNWDFKRSLVSFNQFRTNDAYTEILARLNNSYQGENLIAFNTYGAFAAQGQATNANKLFNFTWSSPNFTLVAGTPLAVANIGRCSSAVVGSDITIYDNVNDTLRGYQIAASQWSQVRNRTSGTTFRYSNVAISRTGGSGLVLIADNQNLIEIYTISGGGYTLGSNASTSELKFPAACWTGTRVALVDERQQTLRAISHTGGNLGYEYSPLSIGDTTRPQICAIDTATETIAFIDAKQRKLQAYRYTAGAFVTLGNALPISNLLAPTIIQESSANTLLLHDTIKGTLQHYSFDGTNWSQTGNTYSISGGYMSSVCSDGTNIMLAISDTHVFNGTIMQDYYSIVNSILFLEGIQGTGAGQYELQSSGTGATKDPNEIVLGAMTDISDNSDDSGSLNRYKYKIGDVLDWYQIFENYWYVEDVAGAYKIKFIQPDSFSTVGTDITVSSLTAAVELNQRVYKEQFLIDLEELILNNTNSQDFDGNVIDYLRETSVKEDVTYPFTTDLEYLIQIFTGQLVEDINSSGLIMYYKDDSTGARLAVSGTGILSTADTKNYLLSQTQIYNDHWDTYRYKDQGNITYNGSSNPVGSSTRNIIEYPEIKLDENTIPALSVFPTSVGSLIWGGLTPKSLIMKLSLDLDKRQYSVFSRLHDI